MSVYARVLCHTAYVHVILSASHSENEAFAFECKAVLVQIIEYRFEYFGISLKNRLVPELTALPHR